MASILIRTPRDEMFRWRSPWLPPLSGSQTTKDLSLGLYSFHPAGGGALGALTATAPGTPAGAAIKLLRSECAVMLASVVLPSLSPRATWQTISTVVRP